MMKLPRLLPRSRAAGPVADGLRLFILVALVAGPALPARAESAGSVLTIQNAWMRLILHERPAAGYFTLKNPSGTARHLVGAASPACGSLMLHKSVHEGGQDRMEMVKALTVPAHGSLTLAPSGTHLMCMAPAASMQRGHTVPVTLRFGDGSTLKANFMVRGANGR